MSPIEIIDAFYKAFQKGDAEEMTKYYSSNIRFEDPAFGPLKGERAISMWKMLINKSKGDLIIEYKNVQANNETGSAEWTATYHYGPKRRKVVNHVKAKFKFSDDKIINHVDEFNFHTWASQALGLTGKLLGRTNYLKKKVQSTTNKMLSKYMSQQEAKQ